MESTLSPDKNPPVPLKTYLWEDLRRAREAGGYPWTHLLKVPLEEEITAEDIIRETTPKRSMSREFSKSRTHSPDDRSGQRILNLDSSPGSSRKHDEEGNDDGVHIPNFSKEVSLDSEEDNIEEAVKVYTVQGSESQSSSHLVTPADIPKNISPKGILKRRVPDNQYIGVTETREKTKCCHLLVNKIKHLADKTLQKLDRNENEKSPITKRKKNEESQEIRQLKSSPGAVRRQKFGAIKLGDSDEMSKTLSIDIPRKKKEHIYEDIEDKNKEMEKSLQFAADVENDTISKGDESNSYKERESISEKKSNASQDPSLVKEDTPPLKEDEHIMEILHKKDDTQVRVNITEEDDDLEEPNVDEIFQNQLEETGLKNESPNITITEIVDGDTDIPEEQNTSIPIETSPSPSPRQLDRNRNEVEFTSNEWSRPNSKLRRWTSEGGTPLEKPVRPTREGSVQLYTPDVRCACQFFQCDSLLPERVNPVGTRPTSRASNIISYDSDHEYEIIEKPPSPIVLNEKNQKLTMVKTDDELSSTTSLERKYLQHTSDEDEVMEYKEDLEEKSENLLNAEALQKDIEEHFFISTPSTVSRTECEISTSQVDSSALENLPLKRESRSKNFEALDYKIQQRIKDGTGKLKTQVGKLKTKLQNIKKKQFSLPEKSNIKFPERPKPSSPERPKFSMPDFHKFSLPDRRNFKKINLSETFHLGDRKFSFPEIPKFNVPDLPKFKMPERPILNLPSLRRKKEHKVETTTSGSSPDLRDVATVEFEAKTHPRVIGRKKKAIPKTSSSPTLNREDTPPPTFTFTRVMKNHQDAYILDSPEQPREYGNIENEINYEGDEDNDKEFGTTYDFDKVDTEYMEDIETLNLSNTRNATSIPDLSPSKQENTHINEINNDEFFVRPRGISRENIQVREYLSDEIRQAFKIPKNVLALMGSNSGVNNDNIYFNEPDADPELMLDDNEQLRYSAEDVNERDDGYYTFPPVRPSRSKQKKKKEQETIQYIDDSINASVQFSEVDLGLPESQEIETCDIDLQENCNEAKFGLSTDLSSIHEYANDDVIEYPENIPIHAQTLPLPPKRKRKDLVRQKNLNISPSQPLESPREQTDVNPKIERRNGKNLERQQNLTNSPSIDLKNLSSSQLWESPRGQTDDIIVYRTEHEYTVPQVETMTTEPSPLPPRRNRSRSSRGTSLCDDDRTSHGAESLTLDTHLPPTDVDIERELRHESPGYATVDKASSYAANIERRSKSKTPPVRSRRKSNSSERKYYTVGPTRAVMPDRPPRKKSSTSLMALNNRSVSTDLTQYVEIDEPQVEEAHKDLKSGEIISKMKDRPLPPPPRPPRGPRRARKKENENFHESTKRETETVEDILANDYSNKHESKVGDIIEIEVSTQTDPLPDDVDFEFGLDENCDVSMSSSLKDIIDEDSMVAKVHTKMTESPHVSRPTSRSEKSVKLSDPKISELSKSNVGRTSPTVILVERRVSSPTRINEREEMLTEASLTVQHIDVDESQIPDVPPLPKSRTPTSEIKKPKDMSTSSEERALDIVGDTSRDVMLDNLITQRLQVRDLDVGRLNVSELQASKILVSDIEGMTLQVSELDSKSGHISVSGIEFSQTVIDEIVKKFAEITITQAANVQVHHEVEPQKIVIREEQTQTDNEPLSEPKQSEISPKVEPPSVPPSPAVQQPESSSSQTNATIFENNTTPPQRPPPPDLTPLLYSYLHDLTFPSPSYYVGRQHPRERPHSENFELHPSPPPPIRRPKRKQAAPHSDSSSDEDIIRASPRRAPPPPPARYHESTFAEAGAQFLRVCHNSLGRIFRNIYNTFMTYLNGTENEKKRQIALVIFLVLIAGVIMYGLSDSRTIHHHHWDFLNPPDSYQS